MSRIDTLRASRRAPCPEEPPPAASRWGALLSMREVLTLRCLAERGLEGLRKPPCLPSVKDGIPSGRRCNTGGKCRGAENRGQSRHPGVRGAGAGLTYGSLDLT